MLGLLDLLAPVSKMAISKNITTRYLISVLLFNKHKYYEIMKAPELGIFTFDVSLGLEPKQTVPKTVVLPLHHETILSYL